MTASSLVITAKDADGRWQLAGRPLRCDTAEVALSAENMAAHGLGVDNLMRLRRHDRAAPGWAVIGRLLRPQDTVTATLDSPPTTHRAARWTTPSPWCCYDHLWNPSSQVGSDNT